LHSIIIIIITTTTIIIVADTQFTPPDPTRRA